MGYNLSAEHFTFIFEMVRWLEVLVVFNLLSEYHASQTFDKDNCTYCLIVLHWGCYHAMPMYRGMCPFVKHTHTIIL